MKMMKKFVFVITLFFFIWLGLIVPRPAKAFSLQESLKPVTSLLVSVGENIQYIFAFTPTSKVKVLESQAQRRLTVAQENTDRAGELISQYQDIKNKQNTFLDKVDDDTLKQIQTQTIEEQKTLARIGIDKPDVIDNVRTVNKTVVEGIKNVVTLKEGTTAGEAFNEKATITYAPGTGPGGPATLIIEGQKFAPGTSGSGNATNDIKNTVIQGGGGTGTGGTTVEGNNPGVAPETSGGGGTETQTVIGQ
jgi:hypothetical protein